MKKADVPVTPRRKPPSMSACTAVRPEDERRLELGHHSALRSEGVDEGRPPNRPLLVLTLGSELLSNRGFLSPLSWALLAW